MLMSTKIVGVLARNYETLTQKKTRGCGGLVSGVSAPFVEDGYHEVTENGYQKEKLGQSLAPDRQRVVVEP